MVCVGPAASRPAISAFGVTLKAWAVVAGLGRAFGSVRLLTRRLSVVWGREMAQKVRLERPGFTSCRGGESGGWLGNNQKDGREVQVWFGHGELSGSGSAFASCSSQGLPVRSRNALQWCRVRMRRGEAQKD